MFALIHILATNYCACMHRKSDISICVFKCFVILSVFSSSYFHVTLLLFFDVLFRGIRPRRRVEWTSPVRRHQRPVKSSWGSIRRAGRGEQRWSWCRHWIDQAPKRSICGSSWREEGRGKREEFLCRMGRRKKWGVGQQWIVRGGRRMRKKRIHRGLRGWGRPTVATRMGRDECGLVSHSHAMGRGGGGGNDETRFRGSWAPVVKRCGRLNWGHFIFWTDRMMKP